MKTMPVSFSVPVTKYFVNDDSLPGSSLLIVSSYATDASEKRTLEFLVFSLDKLDSIGFPHIAKFDSTPEDINGLFEAKLSGTISKYILDRHPENGHAASIKKSSYGYGEVERKQINRIAYPYGKRLLDIIILATDCARLKEEIYILREFILAINSIDGSN